MLWKKQTLLPHFYLLIAVLSSVSLNNAYAQNSNTNKERIKAEIRTMEQAFQDDLKKDGVAAAFYKYAAPDAVIKRENDTLIKGAEAIKTYYANDTYKGAIATWAPDFVEVSDDGSMAYTYGKYRWSMKGGDGKEVRYEGVFHTVWKKMKDGSWKYVWD